MAPVLIEVEGLSKIYRVAEKQPGLAGTLRHFVRRRTRDVVAVQDVSFQIAPGEMVGFLGANGAGKTTTLKMLCGLIHPSSGSVQVAGHRPQRRQAEFLRRITLVMGQKQQLLWDLPPMDSLRVNAAVYGISDQLAQRRINALADLLELGEELTRPVRKLSLGQRMKAELLAALLHEPEVLFLDEPTLGLDALCPRVLLIHQGSLFHDGPLDQLTLALAPEREVRLELEHPVTADALVGLGRLESLQGSSVHLRVARDELTSVVAALLDRFPVVDLEVNDPPIDALIGDLFRQGRV